MGPCAAAAVGGTAAQCRFVQQLPFSMCTWAHGKGWERLPSHFRGLSSSKFAWQGRAKGAANAQEEAGQWRWAPLLSGELQAAGLATQRPKKSAWPCLPGDQSLKQKCVAPAGWQEGVGNADWMLSCPLHTRLLLVTTAFDLPLCQQANACHCLQLGALRVSPFCYLNYSNEDMTMRYTIYFTTGLLSKCKH